MIIRIFALSIALFINNLSNASEDLPKTEVATELVKLAYQGNEPDFNDRVTALEQAGNPKVVNEIYNILIEQSKVAPVFSELKINSLMAAAMQGHEKIVDIILSKRLVDVNAKAEPTGATALMFAIHAKANAENIVKKLLDAPNINVNVINNNNETVLDIADKTSIPQRIKQLLINAGANKAVDVQPAVLNIPQLQNTVNTLTQKLDQLMQQLPK